MISTVPLRNILYKECAEYKILDPRQYYGHNTMGDNTSKSSTHSSIRVVIDSSSLNICHSL